MGVGKVVKVVLALWLLNVLFQLTPPPAEWTSAERVVKEFVFNFVLILSHWYPLMPMRESWYRSLCLNYIWPMMKDDLLPPVGHPSREVPTFITVNSVDELSEQDLYDCLVLHKKGFLIKGYSKGTLEKFSKIDYLIKNFNNDTYHFLSNPHEIKNYKSLGLKEGLKEMKATGQLYMSFADKLVANNPEIDEEINNLLKSTPQFEGHVHYTAVRQSFLSHGTSFRTASHVAPISDWFLQIAGAKRWRFTMPQYAPYQLAYGGPIYPIYYGGIGFLFDDTRVPYVDIVSAAGDLMFFPPHWWHEVHNLDSGFGFAVGFRPIKADFKLMFSTLFAPFLAYHGGYPMRMGLFSAAPYKLWRMYSDKTGGGNAMRNAATQDLRNKTSVDEHAAWFKQHMKQLYMHMDANGPSVPFKSEL